jgi:hypothetical protein
MNAGEKFNQFVQGNGGNVLYLDENLILQKELREETVFWGSVYGSAFVPMPDTAFTSESAYRTWCWKITGMMPAKRVPAVFDQYIRPKMLAAEVRPTLPGTEFGIEIEEAIEHIFGYARGGLRDLDELGAGAWSKSMLLWVETIPGSGNGKELIIKINELMKRILEMESHGNTHCKIKRTDVCQRLVRYGRQVADRNGSINRLRSTYALPIVILYDGFDAVREPG